MNPTTNPRRRVRRAATVAIAASCALAACGGSRPSRADVVGAMTSEVVPARYADAAVDADAVIGAVDEWCSGTDPGVVLDAVAAARGTWIELRPFGFGPANDRRSMFIIDPQVRVVDVDELGTEGQDVDATALREFAGADQRGWGAVEHLARGEATDRRCEYARGAAELTAGELHELAEAWTAYGPSLGEAGNADIALRNIVSESLFAAQMAVDQPDPALDTHRLAGIRTALLGTGPDEGITPLLSADATAALTAALDSGDAREVQITISTDVVGELGTTINFSDADGDG